MSAPTPPWLDGLTARDLDVLGRLADTDSQASTEVKDRLRQHITAARQQAGRPQ